MVLKLEMLAACVLLASGGMALADNFVVPGETPRVHGHRASYRQTHFPPPQYNLLGRRLPTPRPSDRPTYREADQFPPPGGRYGGGFIEYILTGGRPEPIAYPQPAFTPAPLTPVIAPAVVVSPTIAPTPTYGAAPGYAASVAAEPAYAAAASTAQVASSERAMLPKGNLPDVLPREFMASAQ